MNKFLSAAVVSLAIGSMPAAAQSDSRYDDDVYTSGAEAREYRSSSSSSASSSSSSSDAARYDSRGDDGYGESGDSYYDDGSYAYTDDGSGYIDYNDDPYTYSSYFRRFNQPFYNRGYWSAFNNPYWYDPFWVDPFWGYNPWYRPGVTVSFGFGAPYWSSYWGWNTWYGYSGFNSCWGYPYYAGGWGGYGGWNGYANGFYDGYWNGYYAGLNNGYGNGWGGYRQVTYGPRQSLNRAYAPNQRTVAPNGQPRAYTVDNGGVGFSPRTGRATGASTLPSGRVGTAVTPGSRTRPATAPSDRNAVDRGAIRGRTATDAGVRPDRATASPRVDDRVSPRSGFDRPSATPRYEERAAPSTSPRFENRGSAPSATPRIESPRFENRQAPQRSEAPRMAPSPRNSVPNSPAPSRGGGFGGSRMDGGSAPAPSPAPSRGGGFGGSRMSGGSAPAPAPRSGSFGGGSSAPRMGGGGGFRR